MFLKQIISVNQWLYGCHFFKESALDWKYAKVSLINTKLLLLQIFNLYLLYSSVRMRMFCYTQTFEYRIYRYQIQSYFSNIFNLVILFDCVTSRESCLTENKWFEMVTVLFIAYRVTSGCSSLNVSSSLEAKQ